MLGRFPLRRILSLPEVREVVNLDDPRTTLAHREIILRKPFLKSLYADWYAEIKKRLTGSPPGTILELGSGGGFLEEVIPGVVTSDILPLAHCQLTLKAETLPFGDGTLSAILMVNVLHHVPDSARFLRETQRTLKPGGKIVMVEPANTLWSRIIFQNFHHEPFDPQAQSWELEAGNPLSSANGAIPWLVFERDRDQLRSLCPRLKVHSIRYHTPLKYLLSGGVSVKALVPGFSYGFFTLVEKLLQPLSRIIGMFETIEVVKI